jgi:hypothetical protein
VGSSLEDSGVDFLFVVASREDVERGDIVPTLNTLNVLVSSRESALKYRGRVDLRVHGYDDDPRELFEISEVREYLRRLDERFPYWFFFLTTETDALKLVMFSLCGITRVSPATTSVNQTDFQNFIARHFGAFNHVFDAFGVDERINIEMSGELEDYFFGPQASG